MSGGKTAIVLQFEKEILYQMPLFVGMSVYIPGCLCTNSAGNHYDATLLFYPSYKTVAVIAFVCKDDLPFRLKGSSNSCAMQISFWFPLESKKRNGFPSPSVTEWTFVVKPPRLRPVSSW